MPVLEPLWSHSGGDSLYNRMSANQLFRDTNPDQELEIRTKKGNAPQSSLSVKTVKLLIAIIGLFDVGELSVAEKFSECLHVVANEPSLAFFRIQEHVRKSLPQLVEQKHEIQEIQQKVQGCCFDAEYATNAVKNLQKSSVHFQNIQDLLKNAMFMKQQIDYEETKRQLEKKRPSMYTAALTDPGIASHVRRGSSMNRSRSVDTAMKKKLK